MLCLVKSCTLGFEDLGHPKSSELRVRIQGWNLGGFKVEASTLKSPRFQRLEPERLEV